MDDLVSRIGAYIARTGSEPFRWGENDCALWAASLMLELTGKDPAEGLRGTYENAWECRRIVLRSGGIETLCRRLMADFRSGERRNGVCVARSRGQVLAGVLTGGRLVLKTADGIVMPDEFQIIEGWGV